MDSKSWTVRGYEMYMVVGVVREAKAKAIKSCSVSNAGQLQQRSHPGANDRSHFADFHREL